MKPILFDRIPSQLQDARQWLLWRLEERDGKPTKLPVQPDGRPAKSNDPSTWTDFATVRAAFAAGGFSGPGFVFSADDPFYGIDLDGCRDPKTGHVEVWAKEIVTEFGTYAEVSPSETGIKLFCRGTPPVAGKKKLLPHLPSPCADKSPAIEIYSQGRYFAVTGWRLLGVSTKPVDNPTFAGLVKETYFADEAAATAPLLDWRSDEAVIGRASKYIARMPPAIAGQSGHNATFHVACVLVQGFSLGEADALCLLREYNQTCNPPWSEKELLHKVRQAAKASGQKGYLRDAAPERWERISVPNYQEAAPRPEVRQTTIVGAAREYLDSIRHGKPSLVGLGIPDLDYAIGGGVEPGEMVILGARPSHGKSAVGLQACHFWAENGLPSLVVSEEMGARMLGRRLLQFASPVPQEYWTERIVDLEETIAAYDQQHSPVIILESCRQAETVAKEIERHVRESGVKCVVVDYAQLLTGKGKTRYEQVTQVSLALRQVTSSLGIVLLALCQLSRGVESRQGGFVPVMSDLKETGQLEQDADVILFCCWPHRLDASRPYNEYQFFIAKNRNRPINQSAVTCRFLPDRQMVLDPLPSTQDVPRGVPSEEFP